MLRPISSRRGAKDNLDSEALAIEALTFLAGETERLGRFIAVTGLGPETIRNAASNTGFLAAVLDYLVSDETLLIAFAANAGISPDSVLQAQLQLAGPPAA